MHDDALGPPPPVEVSAGWRVETPGGGLSSLFEVQGAWVVDDAVTTRTFADYYLFGPHTTAARKSMCGEGVSGEAPGLHPSWRLPRCRTARTSWLSGEAVPVASTTTTQHVLVRPRTSSLCGRVYLYVGCVDIASLRDTTNQQYKQCRTETRGDTRTSTRQMR